jgi:chemotaxis protein methyltransferase CheR
MSSETVLMKQSGALDATLSEQTFDQLRALIRERAGIDFPNEKRYLLESRVRPRLTACGVSSFDAYVRSLQREQDPDEMAHLLNAVTINETTFFRHPSQFEALGHELLPALADRRHDRGTSEMRLWSAACSAGEEAYSLALLVKEQLKPRFPHVEFQIIGTDIDTEALEDAQTGHYRERAIRNVPTAYLHKYFQRQGDAFVLHPSIREMVTFRTLNLTDAQEVRRMGDFDVIMCANVLIYFDQKRKKQVLQSMHRSLRPGGYLLVGGSEALGESAAQFETVQERGALVYQRPRATSSANSSTSPT